MIKVIRVRPVWNGIYAVTFRVNKSLRHFTELYRQINGQWFTGEAHPTGCCSSPLRQACPAINQALSAVEAMALALHEANFPPSTL